MKTSGSTASLLQGVSQQVPQDRQPGQHTEVINMIPDPVHGLTRRHGTKLVAEQKMVGAAAIYADLVADTENYRTFNYTDNGRDLVLLVRHSTRPAGSTLPVVLAYDKTNKVFLTTVTGGGDTDLTALKDGGVSAITAVGKYVFMGGNTTTPQVATNNVWADAGNANDAVVWVRGGAYSRTYTVKATKTDGSLITFSYTTPSSSYPGVLDTSAVPVLALDPAGGTGTETESAFPKIIGGPLAEYTLNKAEWTPTALTAKIGSVAMTNTYPAAPTNAGEFRWNAASPATVEFAAIMVGRTDITLTYTALKTVTNPAFNDIVRDMTNTYQSAVTNWIGTAATAIQPENIAEQLRLAGIAAGLVGLTRVASTVVLPGVKGITASDGGDGSLVRAVANEVTDTSQVTDIHRIGKIVKVRAQGSAEAFYLKATSKDPSITSGYAEVTWIEGAGVVYTLSKVLFYGLASGSSFYVASSAANLNAIIPGTHPDYSVSTVGDADSSPPPFFAGRKITYLGMMQDRLLIGAGAVLSASKTGDYLNFFRSSVLTLTADDYFELLSQGSEDDILRFSVLYDQNLVLFGDKRQYVVSGRSALTPTSANMAVMSSHADASAAPPLSMGGYIFYGKRGEESSSLHQIQPSLTPESPESFDISSQVDTYITGRVIELCSNAKPTHMLMRTTGNRGGLYLFTYLDKGGEGRAQDAWHKWVFSEETGTVIGVSPDSLGPLVFSLRVVGADVYLVCDQQPMLTKLSFYPYLDSMRTLAAVNAGTGSVVPSTTGDWAVAFDRSSEFQFQGDSLANVDDLLEEFPLATGPYVGALYEGQFSPTNPYLRDRNDKAVLSGQLTVTVVTPSLASSSGFWADLTARGSTITMEYNGRILGLIGEDPHLEVVADFQQPIPIGHETREYSLLMRSRKWLPLTITSLEWVGQFFNRTQRM